MRHEVDKSTFMDGHCTMWCLKQDGVEYCGAFEVGEVLSQRLQYCVYGQSMVNYSNNNYFYSGNECHYTDDELTIALTSSPVSKISTCIPDEEDIFLYKLKNRISYVSSTRYDSLPELMVDSWVSHSIDSDEDLWYIIHVNLKNYLE